MIGLLPAFLLALANEAFADVEAQWIAVRCDGKLRNFHILSSDDPNERHAGSPVYTDFNKHDVRCAIGKTVVESNFQLLEPQATGACGAYPGGQVNSIKIDGTPILENFRIHGCGDSIGSVSVQNVILRDGSATYQLELCGSYRSLDGSSYHGCVTVEEEQAKRILQSTKGPGWTKDPFVFLLQSIR